MTTPRRASRTGDQEDQQPKKDRNAAYKALLEADARRAKQKTAHGIEGEAEESDEENGQMGLGDFGFGVSKPKQDQEEQEDVKITEDDLEAVVDELSDGEGDEEGAEQQRAKEERKREREEMAQMLGGSETGSGGQDARGGAFGIDDLVVWMLLQGKRLKVVWRIATTRRSATRTVPTTRTRTEEDDEGDEERGLAALISQSSRTATWGIG